MLLKFYLSLFYVYKCLPACMFMYKVHAVTAEAKRDCRFPGTGVTNSTLATMEFLGTESRSSQEQQMFLITEPAR